MIERDRIRHVQRNLERMVGVIELEIMRLINRQAAMKKFYGVFFAICILLFISSVSTLVAIHCTTLPL
jgi:hypothetical protein